MGQPMVIESTIRDMFKAIDANDFELLGNVFESGAIYERPGYKQLIGLDAILYYYKNVRIIASGQHRVERVVTASDAACCWGSFTGASRDGQKLSERFADCYYFEHGKIARRITHFFRPAI